ncbi:MAG: hypothetical protein WA713_10815, partial [Candidatus Acidiferrales bacterium]
MNRKSRPEPLCRLRTTRIHSRALFLGIIGRGRRSTLRLANFVGSYIEHSWLSLVTFDSAGPLQHAPRRASCPQPLLAAAVLWFYRVRLLLGGFKDAQECFCITDFKLSVRNDQDNDV